MCAWKTPKGTSYLLYSDTKDPDLILLTEPDLLWTKSLIELDDRYPYSIKEPLANTYGMILLSGFLYWTQKLIIW